jgi:glucosamine kinase
MTYVIGIDGGGSNVRVVVSTPDLKIVGQGSGGSANPNSVGREAAAQSLLTAVRAALADAGRTPDDIAAAAAGVAGALSPEVQAWLHDLLGAVLPGVPLIVTLDLEIALVGAHGRRCGVLILAGTGSAAYGVNEAGESLLVGGWGYLLGDEGGGYWIGLQALREVARAADGINPDGTRLTKTILDALNLTEPRQVVPWLYGQSRVKDVAALAPLVLAAADDVVAGGIIASGAAQLNKLVDTLRKRLHFDNAPIAFAGGLLSEPNPLSLQLCAALELPALPVSKYPPVMGAVILALESIGLKPNAD